jgi:uncharacterized protein YeaO (DUF488 family)
MTRIWIKRAYEAPAPQDGRRVLVDRVWPRGVKKEELKLDGWMRELAPSTELRKWFGHDPEKWDEFRLRYAKELDAKPEAVESLRARLREGRVTLIYGAKDERRNNAAALKSYMEEDAG